MKKLAILSLCLLCLCGCGKKEEKTPINDTTEAKITIEEIETILDDELYVLWNKNEINEVTNNERLTLGIKKYAKDNNLDFYDLKKVKAGDVEESFKTTSIGNLTLKHEDIMGSYKITLCEHIDWKYNAEAKEYTTNIMGHGVCAAKEIYRKLIDLKEESGKYIATYKYMFTYGCEGDITRIYGSYEDALKENNKLAEIGNVAETKEEFDQIVASKYDGVEDKLAIYTYTFERINDKITLIDFNRK